MKFSVELNSAPKQNTRFSSSLHSCQAITFTLVQISLGKVWISLLAPTQLWTKQYYYCSSTRMVLTVNNPWRLIYRWTKKPKHSLFRSALTFWIWQNLSQISRDCQYPINKHLFDFKSFQLFLRFDSAKIELGLIIQVIGRPLHIHIVFVIIFKI